jgi:hypothetical protein
MFQIGTFVNKTVTNLITNNKNEIDFSKPSGNPKGWWFQIVFGDILNWFHRNGMTPMWFATLFICLFFIPLSISSYKGKNNKSYILYILIIIIGLITSIFIQVKSYS